MKFTFVILLGVGIIASSSAAVAKVQLAHPDHPSKCVIDEHFIMSPGETGKAPNHLCAGVTCLENSYVIFRTCAAVPPPKGCKLRDFVNTDRPYPECCERSYECSREH